MLRRLDGLLILSTDKAKYFSKFRPSVVLRVSVSFALYCETNFERLLSCTLRRVKHFPLFFFHLSNKYIFASTCIRFSYIRLGVWLDIPSNIILPNILVLANWDLLLY